MARGTRPSSERCPRCALPPAHCICAELPRVPTRTRIVVIRHARELYKPSGTARLAALALPGLELIDYRDEPGTVEPPWLTRGPIVRPLPVLPPEAVGARLAALAPAHLLFPTGRPMDQLDDGTGAGPRTLIVLDGTWRQARAMYTRIPGLGRMPALRLADATPEGPRLRRPIRPGERSTLEAIADALAALEGEEIAAPLRALHRRFVLAAESWRWGAAGRPAETRRSPGG
jgi:DTW domain-containing protein